MVYYNIVIFYCKGKIGGRLIFPGVNPLPSPGSSLLGHSGGSFLPGKGPSLGEMGKGPLCRQGPLIELEGKLRLKGLGYGAFKTPTMTPRTYLHRM